MKAPIAKLYQISIACLLSACASHNGQLQETDLPAHTASVPATPKTLPAPDQTQNNIKTLTPRSSVPLAATIKTPTSDNIRHSNLLHKSAAHVQLLQQSGQTGGPAPATTRRWGRIIEPDNKLIPTTPTIETINTNSQIDEEMPAQSAAISAPLAQTTVVTLTQCSEITFQPGSLRANIERAINDCGYVMGRWVFGTGNKLLDWDVPLGFHTQAEQGLTSLLAFIEHNYQIRAHVHQLDRSIDFLPSINQASQVPDHEDH